MNAVTAALTCVAFLGLGTLAATAMTAGADGRGPWMLYFWGGLCCMLPFAAVAGWMVTQYSRETGRAALAGLAIACVLAALAGVAGFYPPWVAPELSK